jgi:hypothetical protein
MDKVQKPSSNECYTPSSEPFRMNTNVYSNFKFISFKPIVRRTSRHMFLSTLSSGIQIVVCFGFISGIIGHLTHKSWLFRTDLYHGLWSHSRSSLWPLVVTSNTGLYFRWVHEVYPPPSAASDNSNSRLISESKSKLSFDRRSVVQSVLVSGCHLGPATKFSFTTMKNIFRQFGIVIIWRPRRREDESIIYSCCCFSPEWASFCLIPAVLTAVFYCHNSGTPPTWRARFLSPPTGIGWLSDTPGPWVPFLSPFTTRRDRLKVFSTATGLHSLHLTLARTAQKALSQAVLSFHLCHVTTTEPLSNNGPRLYFLE